MKRIKSPEICLRYVQGVSDLPDPYFQAVALRHRMLPVEEDRDRANIAAWGSMLCVYSAMVIVIPIFDAIAKLHLGVAVSATLIGTLMGFVMIAFAAAAGIDVLRVLHRAIRYRILFPPTYVGLSAEGIRLLGNFMSRSQYQFFSWDDVTSIALSKDKYLDFNLDSGQAKSLQKAKVRVEPCIDIRNSKGQLMRLRLSAIRSIEERQVLVSMIKKYARRVAEKDDIAQIIRVNRMQDLAFTQLWSNALKSKDARLTNALLESSSLLQNGRFMVKAQIGGGGQGAIYSAEMIESGGEMRLVALKEYFLPDTDHIFDRKRAVEQFEREVYLLTKLQHESIVPLIDAFVEDHRAYLVMELVSGETIKDLVKNSGPLSQDRAVAVFSKLCQVLSYMHELEPAVVHLDVTPDNIIIGDDGRVTLLDFNTSSDGSGLRTKLIAGKQRYMSPEQFRSEISPLCDIYALGCTMFYALTGQEAEPLTKCDTSSYRSDLSADLAKSIAGATELEGTQRIQSVRDIEKTLSSLTKELQHA